MKITKNISGSLFCMFPLRNSFHSFLLHELLILIDNLGRDAKMLKIEPQGPSVLCSQDESCINYLL